MATDTICDPRPDLNRGWLTDPERRPVERAKKPPTSPSVVVVEKFREKLKGVAKLAIVVGRLAAIKAVATELFDEIRSMEIVEDPEIPEYRYVTVAVRARGDARTAARLRMEWHRKLSGLLGAQSQLVHLAIDIDE